MTEAKQELAQNSLPPLEATISDLIDRGAPPFDRELVTVPAVQIELPPGVRGIATPQRVSAALLQFGATKLERRITTGDGRVTAFAMRSAEYWQSANNKEIIANLKKHSLSVVV